MPSCVIVLGGASFGPYMGLSTVTIQPNDAPEMRGTWSQRPGMDAPCTRDGLLLLAQRTRRL
eukprot:4337866-Prymnesium_polylepis.3